MEEVFKVSKANLVVYLHPSKTKVVRDSVMFQLASLLFKYNENFEGVPLAYEAGFPSKRGKILPGLDPYIGVGVKAKLLLFCPRPNTHLEGKVVKVARESIHVVVLGFSAATITEEDIRDDFKFKLKHGQGSFRSKTHKRHVIKEGAIIRFWVKSFDEELLHISGSLIPEGTGSVQWLSVNSDGASMLDRSSRKLKESEERTEERSAGTVERGSLSSKTKKRRINEEF